MTSGDGGPGDDPTEYLDLREEWDGTGAATSKARPAATETTQPVARTAPDVGDAPEDRIVRGIARGVDIRRDQDETEKLTFRVDRYDADGNRLTPVPVEMHRYRGGMITDGDEIEVEGRWSHGTLRATRINNLTTASEIRGWFPRSAKWIAVGALALLVILAVVLALVLTRGSSSASALVPVPDVTGQTQDAALAALGRAGFSPHTSTEPSATTPAGNVVRTVPPAGENVTKNSTVLVVVSSGPLPTTSASTSPNANVGVPNVVGQDANAATSALRQLGLVPQARTQPSDSMPAGRVIATDPTAGTPVLPGSTVTMLVSSGSPPPTTAASASVPGVAGLSQNAATQSLEAAGLSVTVVNQASDTLPAGTAIGTNPSVGTHVSVGSKVQLLVSTGPTPVTP